MAAVRLVVAGVAVSLAAGAAPAAAAACTHATAATLKLPAGWRSAVAYVDGRRTATLRRGVVRRLTLTRGRTYTIKLVGRSRHGRRVTRTRRVQRCAAPVGGLPPVSGAVAPDDPHLRFEGRWEVTHARATSVTSGARMLLRFRGTTVTARLTPTRTPAHVYAVLDGRKGPRYVVDHSPVLLTPAGLSPGEHTLELTIKDVSDGDDRWQPPFGSALQLDGVDVPTGTQLIDPPPLPARRFTFLGDSITQGAAMLCPLPGSDCADATLAYPRIVADAFGAGFEQVGFSGQGVTKGGAGGVPPAGESLGLTYAGRPAPSFDADLVVINEGTNDKADPGVVQAAYVRYLSAVRSRYPRARILALQPFGTAGQLTTDDVRAAVAQSGDPRVTYVPTRGWLLAGDFTDETHPTSEGHRKIAAHLIELIGSGR